MKISKSIHSELWRENDNRILRSLDNKKESEDSNEGIVLDGSDIEEDQRMALVEEAINSLNKLHVI